MSNSLNGASASAGFAVTNGEKAGRLSGWRRGALLGSSALVGVALSASPAMAQTVVNPTGGGTIVSDTGTPDDQTATGGGVRIYDISDGSGVTVNGVTINQTVTGPTPNALSIEVPSGNGGLGVTFSGNNAISTTVSGGAAVTISNTGNLGVGFTSSGSTFTGSYGFIVNNPNGFAGFNSQGQSQTIIANGTAVTGISVAALLNPEIYLGTSTISGFATGVNVTTTDTRQLYALVNSTGGTINATQVGINIAPAAASTGIVQSQSAITAPTGIQVSGGGGATITTSGGGTINSTSSGTGTGIFATSSAGTSNVVVTVGAAIGGTTPPAKGIVASTTGTSTGAINISTTAAISATSRGIDINQVSRANTGSVAIGANVTAGTGIYSFNGVYDMTVASGATVTGTAALAGGGVGYGIYATNTPGTVTNSGTIRATGTGGIGVYLNGDGVVTNNASGLISGATGIQLDNMGTLTNAGTVTGLAGVGLQNFGGTTTNTGSITGTTDGIRNTANVFNLNNTGGSITGGTNGVYVTGGILRLANTGTIQTTGGTAGAGLAGVRLASTLTVQNQTITNSGTISGGSDATHGYGIDVEDGIAVITNQSGGNITGGTGAIRLANANASTVTLNSGSTVTGDILSTNTGTRALTVAGLLSGNYNAAAGTGATTFTLNTGGSIQSVSMGNTAGTFTWNGGTVGGTLTGGTNLSTLNFNIGAGNTASLASITRFFGNVNSGTLILNGQTGSNGAWQVGATGLLRIGSSITVSSASTFASLQTAGGRLQIDNGVTLSLPGTGINVSGGNMANPINVTNNGTFISSTASGGSSGFIYYGINNNGGGYLTVNNTGSILTGNFDYTAAINNALTTIVTNSGTIQGGATGSTLLTYGARSTSGTLTLNNTTAASVIAGGAQGVLTTGGTLSVTNAGFIVGTGDAINAAGTTTITNNAGGTIGIGTVTAGVFTATGGTGSAIATAGSATIINDGTLYGNSFAAITNASNSVLTLTNRGTITSGAGGDAVAAIGTANVLNSGTISTSVFSAVNAVGGGTIVNATGGVLMGGNDATFGEAVQFNAGTAIFTNYGSASSTIGKGVFVTGAAATTINLQAGSTTGSIQTGSGNDTLNLYNGRGTASTATVDAPSGITLQNAGTLAGATIGAIDLGGGTNTLTLRGTGDGTAANGAAGTIASASVAGLTNLSKLDSGMWTLTGAGVYAGTTTVSGGTLRVLNTGNGLGDGNVSIASGATLQFDNQTGGQYAIKSTTFTGAGRLLFTGSTGSSTSFGNAGNVTVSLSQGGLIDVQSGTVAGSASGQGFFTGNLGSLNIASGAIFDGVEGTIIVDGLTGAGLLRGGFFGSGSTTIGIANGSATFTGTIADSTNFPSPLILNKVGTGTQTLSGVNTYTGGTNVLAGTLVVTTATNSFAADGLGSSGTVAISAGATVRYDNPYTSVITGPSGSQIYASHNTYTGAGTLAFTGNAASLTVLDHLSGTADVALSQGGLINVQSGHVLVRGAGVFAGNQGNLAIATGAVFEAAADITVNSLTGGGSYIGGGSTILTVGVAGGSGQFDGTIANGGSPAGLTKVGAGVETLSGVNTYSGATTISGGTLALTGAGSIASSSGVIANGIFDISGHTGTASIRSLTGSGTVNVGQNALSLTAASGTFSGVIAGTIGSGFYSLQINGSQTLTGVNTYTGWTSVNTGSTLFLSGNGSIAASQAIGLFGTLNISGHTGGVTVQNVNDQSFTPASIILGANTLTTNSLTLSGTASGTGGLTFANGFSSTLFGANTYTGTTTIGTSAALFLNGTGSITSSAVVNNGSLNIASHTGGTSIVNLSGAGTTALGANTLTLTNASGTYSGAITGTGGLTKQGAGTYILSGSNSYTGTTTISAGTLQGTTNSIAGSSIVDNATLTYNQAFSGTATQNISGSGRVTVTGLGANTLTFAGNLTNDGVDVTGTSIVSFGGTNSTSGRTVNVSAVSTTINILDNASLSSGGTPTIFSGATGTIVNNLGAIASTSDIAVNLSQGGTFNNGSASDSVAGATGGFIGFASGSALATINNYGAIRGTSLDGINAPTLNLTNFGTGIVTGGRFGIGGNVLTIGNAGLIVGSTSGVSASSTVAITNSGLIGAGTLSGTTQASYTASGGAGIVASNGGTITNLNGGTISGGTASIQLTGAGYTVNLNAGSTTTGLIDASGTSGTNSYTVAGTLNGGLAAGGGNDTVNLDTSATVTGSIDGGAGTDAVVLTGSGTSTLSSDITGFESLTKNGTGTFTLSGTNSGFNTVAINTGTLNSASASAIGNAAVTVASGATFGVDTAQAIGSLAGAGNVTLSDTLTAGGNDSSTIFSGIASGVGGLTKTGAGTLTLSGANTFTGDVTIAGGTLAYGANDVLDDGVAVTVNSGTTFNLNGFSDTIGTLNLYGTLSNGGLLTAGTYNAYAGSTINQAISSGTLNIYGDTSLTSATTASPVNIITGTLALSQGGSLSQSRVVADGTLDLSALGGASVGISTLNKIDQFYADFHGSTTPMGPNQLSFRAAVYGVNAIIGFTNASGQIINVIRTSNDDVNFYNVVSGDPLIGTLCIAGANTACLTATGSVQDLIPTITALNNGSGLYIAGQSSFDATIGDLLAGSGSSQILSLAGSGSVILGGTTLVIGNADDAFSGAISGAGGVTLTAGNQALTGTNSYTGLTTLDGGTLTLDGGAAIADGNMVLVNAGGTLALLASERIGSLNGAGAVSLNANTLFLGTNDLDSSFSGIASGTGGITKTGAGTLTLSGANSYIGYTSIYGGSLVFGASDVLADTSTLIIENATADLGANNDTIAALLLTNGTLNGTGTLTAGEYALQDSVINANLGTGYLHTSASNMLTTLNGTSAASTVESEAGTLALGASDRLLDTATLYVDRGSIFDMQGFSDTVGSLGLQGTLDGTGTLTAATYFLTAGIVNGNLGTGSVYVSRDTLSGDTVTTLNGTSAATSIQVNNLATLALGAADRIADTTTVSVNAGGTLDIAGFNDTVGSLTLGGTLNGTGTLTAASYVLAGGTVNANIGDGTLTQVSGSSVLNGTSTAATVAINGGTLVLGASNRLADVAAVVVASGAALDLNSFTDTVGSLTVAGTLSGSGTLTAATYSLTGGTVNANLGTGILTQTSGTSTLFGTSAAATVRINGGTLALGASERLANNAALSIASGATLDLRGFDETVGLASISGTLNSNPVRSQASTRIGGAQGALVQLVQGTGTLTAASYDLIGATINGNLGTGTLNQLSGTSTLNGTAAATVVAITGGTLVLGAADRLADTAAVSVASGSTLALGAFTDTVGSLALAGTLSGTGTLTAAQYQLTGATVNANLGTGSLFQLGGVSTLNGTAAATAVQVQGGTLMLGTSNRLADAANVAVSSGATLNLGGNLDTVGIVQLAGTLAGTGSLTAAQYQLTGATVNANLGAGTLFQLGGTSTLNGTAAATAVAINGGTLALGANERLADNAAVQIASGATFDLTGKTETIGALGGTGTLALGSGRLVIGGTNADSGFGGALTGSGDVDKNGTGTFTLASNLAQTGRINLNAGTTQFTGSTAGSVRIQGGTLTGGAAIAGNLALTSGTFAPGTSAQPIAAFSAGSLTVSGGTLAFDLGGAANNFAADQLRVSGAAALTGGTVATRTIDPTANYRLSQNYVLVSAAALTGAFANGGSFAAIGNNADLQWRLRYDLIPNSVVLELRKQVDFTTGLGAGASGNQMAVGGALNGGAFMASDNWAGILNTINDQDGPTRRATFDSISGESVSDISSATIIATTGFTDLLRQRLSTGASGGGDANLLTGLVGGKQALVALVATAPLDGAATLSGASGSADSVSDKRGGVWLQGFGANGTINGQSGQAKVGTYSAGVAGGIDIRSGNVTVGGAFSVSQVETQISSRTSRNTGTLYQGGGYVAYDDGRFYGSVIGSYFSGDINSRRSVFVGGTQFGVADGQTMTRGYSAGAALGYRIAGSGGVVITPQASFTATGVERDAFNETGAGGLSLQVARDHRVLYAATAEGRISRPFDALGGVVEPYIGGGAIFSFGDLDTLSVNRFSGAPTGTGTFTIQGARLAPFTSLVNAGIDVRPTSNVRLGLQGEARLSNRQSEQRISLNLRIGF
ncbi:autotransporter-associated beta strand repeat-containing protein [Sphingomonas sp. 28-63-12]|uniref:autotransporter-associated beta strand repeat-containing protein n=1 Tax=Sphingomonas sp. 28-63-12 TaxID=1970434 RepID=UPI000BC5FC74|nr:MAG: hypothetical protein B7Y47_06010 [Sphingomonas sp. 28-63-12]